MIKRIFKVIAWILAALVGLLILLFLSSPLIAWMGVDYKYQTLNRPGNDASGYLATAEGAQPRRACGGTAGQYNWGESVRQYVSLNGQWPLAQGQLDDNIPETWTHSTPVPGLLVSATPPLAGLGQASTKREAFWLKHNFDAPGIASDSALLCVAKAKYGIKVWLNGVELGRHYGAFTQAEFDLRPALRWGESNELIIRLGAERSGVPDFIPVGQDHEKEFWQPGIWDDVNLLFSGAQTIVRSKVETNSQTSRARIISWLFNSSEKVVELELRQQLKSWPDGNSASEVASTTVTLQPGEEQRVEQELTASNARLWTLENPSLYLAHSSLNIGDKAIDDQVVRFGFRDVAWRSGDEKGFYLNGEKLFLRGSNISLHRFFEDPLVGTHPWDERWVRQLLGSYPREYDWNILRTSIGRLPNFWYDIADELGILIDDEFAWWTLMPPEVTGSAGIRDLQHLNWSIIELEKEFTSWMQENWNHPSIAWWSASNETTDLRSREIIERVRGLDPTRQWENGGWQAPEGANDPIEDHPYIFSANFNPLMDLLGRKTGSIEVLDEHEGQPPRPTDLLNITYPSWDHPHIINEFGWLWLDRQGNPTLLTEDVYARLLGKQATAGERREAYAYLHAGLTGFWRSRRGYAGVQHFSYLNHSKPGAGFTSDNFIDLPNLVMEPRWHEYSKNIWKPVLLYINRWDQDYRRGAIETIPLTIINDHNRDISANYTLLAIDPNGNVLSQSGPHPVNIPALGQLQLEQDLTVPDREKFVLFARLDLDDDSQSTQWDRRKVGLAHPGVITADPPFNTPE
jgi:hypothetical protein